MWTDIGGFPEVDRLPVGDRLYCNRTLRLDQVQIVGFDMDYTLAIYNQREMDRLGIEATVRNLIAWGYPRELATMPYRADFGIRGLLVDAKRGNVLKIDRHRYVKKAYHGHTELDRDERLSEYESRQLRPGSGRYRWVDTLYELSEVAVYAAAVDQLEAMGEEVDYEQLLTDVRRGVDTAHRNGDIFAALRSDLGRYLRRDNQLGPTLHRLRSAGKRLFVLTNSPWQATNTIMSYLLDDALPEYPSWQGYFDIVVTAAGKPGFFTGDRPFLAVDADGGTEPAGGLERGGVYAEGNITELDRFLDSAGDGVLYVGDHIYGDVLRAKLAPGWRTVMIIQELPHELEGLATHREQFRQIDELEELRRTHHDQVRFWRSADADHFLGSGQLQLDFAGTHDGATPEQWKRAQIDHHLAAIRSVEEQVEQLEAEVDTAFHPYWGSLFRAGTEVSSFGSQVLQYACLYTDRVSNLGSYSPVHYFRSPRQRLPHDVV